MKQRILDKVEESFKKAEAFYGRTFSRPRNIIFKRTGRTAGHCNHSKSELMFQIALAEHEGDKFINRTPGHEVAHWIDKELHGYQKRGKVWDKHGENWKYIMTRVMKQDCSRCHSYDTVTVLGPRRVVKRNRYEYSCSNGHNLIISSVIHNRIMGGNRKGYRCKCGGSISLKIPSKEEQIAELRKRIESLSLQTS
jgi:predicted SprT family Zn-dependent metalloprotease